MTDLVTATSDALNRREALVPAATRKRWRPYAGKHRYMGIQDVFSVHHRAGGYGAQPSKDDEAFIADNDPARVLRDIAAKRKVLGRHEPLASLGALGCGHCHDGFNHGALASWPCPEILGLAEAEGVSTDG